MRSASSPRAPTRLLAAGAAAALCACGNFSTDDVAFVEALPTRDGLQVVLPSAGAQPLCGPLGEATQWTQARQTGVGMNAGLDWILGVVDLVRSLPPTERHRDQRVWGPFPDGKHPGFQDRFVVDRSSDADGLPIFAFAFEARDTRVTPPDAWHALISGRFVGASGRTGRGDVTLHFAEIRRLGLNDKPDDPAVDITIGYDRRGDPRQVSLEVPPGSVGFGLVNFDYGFFSWASGHARLDFAVQDAPGNRFQTVARFSPGGAGRGDVTLVPANPPPASIQFSVCWDGGGCLTAVDDLFNVARHCASAPCRVNWPAGCTTDVR